MLQIDQEPDRVPRGPIRTAAVVIAAAIAASVGAVLLLWNPGAFRELTRRHEPPPPPARIDVIPYQLPTEAELLRRAADERLRSYGWVDRATSIVHVPLAVAIDLYLGEAAR